MNFYQYRQKLFENDPANLHRSKKELMKKYEAYLESESNDLEAEAPRTLLQTVEATPNEVVIIDIDMPFRSMVNFIVKWTLASIPAALILAGIGWLLFNFLGSIARIQF